MTGKRGGEMEEAICGDAKNNFAVRELEMELCGMVSTIFGGRRESRTFTFT